MRSRADYARARRRAPAISGAAGPRAPDFLLARVDASGELLDLTEDDIRLWMCCKRIRSRPGIAAKRIETRIAVFSNETR